MSNEFQVVFHNIDQSDSLVDNVNKRIDKLQRYSNDIIGGRIVLDSPHNNHHKGKVYSVTVELHTSKKEIVVKQGQHDKPEHEDLYVAIRDAFNAAERQLKSIDKKHRATGLAPEDFEVPLGGADEEVDDDDEVDSTVYSFDERDEYGALASHTA
ncbi:MAG: HPF/RaiA family ribosome-associated protein [Pseudohongiellaceae bacterium]|nr:HPF/RaiA family ribosome-associated protein [Pseudohongiellaceae bacterium]